MERDSCSAYVMYICNVWCKEIIFFNSSLKLSMSGGLQPPPYTAGLPWVAGAWPSHCQCRQQGAGARLLAGGLPASQRDGIDKRRLATSPRVRHEGLWEALCGGRRGGAHGGRREM